MLTSSFFPLAMEFAKYTTCFGLMCEYD